VCLINLSINTKIALLIFSIYKFLVNNIFVIKFIVIVSNNCEFSKDIELNSLYNL